MSIGSQFESIGAWLPDKVLTTDDLVNESSIPSLKKLALLTGIRERRICSDGEDSVSLAVNAAKECLSRSKYIAENIELIISCSITKYVGGLKHQFEPAVSINIKNALGAINANHFDISNACAGMLTGVYIADSYIRAGIVKNCLVVSGEYISSLAKNDILRIGTMSSNGLASLTLGDAGAAVILESTESANSSISVLNFRTLSQYNRLCVGKQSQKGPGATMKTNAKKIHDVSIKDSYPIVKDALTKLDLSFNRIDYLIPHQTSRSAIRSGINYYSEKFGVRPSNVIINLDYCGNTASTSHFLAIYNNLKNNVFKEQDKIMLLCMASGLVIGVVIFNMNKMVYNYGIKD